MYGVEIVLFLCTVHISDVRSGRCSICVYSTHFWYAVWKVFCFCAQYTFLMCRLEGVLFVCTVHISDVPSGTVLFLCTVHISDVPSERCSICVHSRHFWCTVWKVFCFCAHYTFLMYRLESVLFLCTVHISHAKWCDVSLSNRFLTQVVCCFNGFFVILPYWKQFQSLPTRCIM